MGRDFVLDSSAVLAVINLEKGRENVEPKFPNSYISSVNVAEILTKLAEKDVNLRDALDYFLQVGLEVVEFDVSHALECAALRPFTKHLGLSLGDRACLALAMQKNATAVTGDRSWADVNTCKIEVIR